MTEELRVRTDEQVALANVLATRGTVDRWRQSVAYVATQEMDPVGASLHTFAGSLASGIPG